MRPMLLRTKRKTNRKGTRKMSLWNVANDVEELAYKLANLRDMVELIAEDVEDPYSGALWAVKDLIDDIQNKVFEQAEKAMVIHRETIKPKKKKK
jgi:hypothetical protein